MKRRRWIVGLGVVGILVGAVGLWAGSDPGSTDPVDPTGPPLRVSQTEPANRGRPLPAAAPGPSASAPAPDGDGGSPVALGGASSLSDEELAALEKELQESPQVHVVCDLGVEVRHSRGYLAIGPHSGFNGRHVQVVNGKAYLPLVYDLGEMGDQEFDERSGTFSLEGYGPQTIAWSDPGEDGRGACTAPIAPEPAQASLVGTLTLRDSGAPATGAWVEGCGNLGFADDRGVVYMDIVSEPCTILAMRQDGLLRTVSDPMVITPVPGEDVVVDIQIPDAPRGGLGIQISQDDLGRILIDGVLDTGPAGSVGLQEGDVVVAVDGESTEGMPLGEFVKAVGGEAGTSVELRVDRNGEAVTFDIVRETLTEG